MSKRRTSMNKIREILRLHECELSNRKISQALRLSRPVVSQYISDLKTSGLKYEDIKDMADESLLEILDRNKKAKDEKYRDLSSRFGNYTMELKRVGVTKETLWEEYRRENPSGYSYSRFCYHFQVWQNSLEVTMHMDHKAGDKAFVDFTGRKLVITDKNTGQEREVEVFVGILGASQLTYVEATYSQKKEDWIKANRNMLHYFVGSPQAIVPDCLKSAVTTGNKYEPDVNREYYDFARHYGITILPARPNHPQDKAHVENAVKIIYSRIFAPLRDMTFYSLSELNEAIREKLEEHNSKPMQRLKVSRRELFNEIERTELQPLPSEPYELRNFKKLTVQFNHHIYFSEDKHYYSVPYRYVKKTVDVLYTDSIIDIYYKNSRIALHKRDRSLNKYTTIKEHMPRQHKWVSDWTPERFIKWAADIGESTKTLVEHVLNTKQHPEQGYKTCLGI
jgi:transposase